MHPTHVRREALRLAACGASTAAIARACGVSRSAVRAWLADPGHALTAGAECAVCDGERALDRARYAYLLGQYLGDGHLVTRARIPTLRVIACTDYPAVLLELKQAIQAVRGRPGAEIRLTNTARAVKVQSYWMHWPCLLPQHGPGLKHTRAIVLADWQLAIADERPWPLIRGLIHSDGCRSLNRVVTRGKAYTYPRYFLSNESRDILAIMGRALDRVGVAWRYNRPNSISIARRDAVAIMDEQVGPKR